MEHPRRTFFHRFDFGLMARIIAMSTMGVVLLGICMSAVTGHLLHKNAEEAALERVDSNMKVAWLVLRAKGSGFHVEDDRLMIGSYVLNDTFAVVDLVQELVGGTCTIFLNDTRISTNVLKANGSRAVGTTLAQGPAYEAIFTRKESFRGQVDILGEPYMTAYDPILTNSGKVVGVLYVGMKKREFLRSADTAQMLVWLTTLAMVALALGCSVQVARSSITGPLKAAIAAMRGLAEGHLDITLPAIHKNDEIGEMARALVVFRDNAAQRVALEAAGEEARNRLTTAIESIADGFVLFSPDDTLLVCNTVWQRMWGFGPEVTGRSFASIQEDVIWRFANGQLDWAERRMQGHNTGVGTQEYRLNDGRVIHIRERRTADGCVVGLYSDVTEHMETQATIMRQEKMAALGGLVAGVAHEINTPVGIGLTAASHLEEKVNDFKRLYTSGQVKRADMDSFIATAAEVSTALLTNLRRAADLVRSFKQVAVDQSSEQRRVFGMREYLDEILLSLQPQFKRTKHVIAVECPDDLILNSYPGALSQILTNLLLNSLIHGFEFKPEGRIDISASVVNGEMALYYRDNGKGMSEEEASRIFEPFFTTKRGNGGSGLGMHVVYNLVTQTLNGDIECVTAPDQGVLFVIRLPQTQENPNGSALRQPA
jgi:signal transduction histidine kinase